jgi:hypothetical protein
MIDLNQAEVCALNNLNKSKGIKNSIGGRKTNA